MRGGPRKRRGPIGALLIVAVLSASRGLGQGVDESEAAFKMSVEFVSRYVWRGYDLSHGDPALLASLTWTPPRGRGFWLEVDAMGGVQTAPALGDERNGVDEVDVTAGWETDALARGRLTLGGALAYYSYLSAWTRDAAYQDESDMELNAYLAWDAARHFRGTLEYYRGLDDGIRGDYVEGGITMPFGGERWDAEPFVTAGWSSQYDVSSRLTNVSAGLRGSIRFGTVTVAPALVWTWVEDPEAFNPEELTGEPPREVLFQATLRIEWSF